MSQSDQQLFLQSRSFTYGLIAATATAIALVLQGQLPAAALNGALLTALLLLRTHPQARTGGMLQHGLLALLSGLILVGLACDLPVLPWLMLPPLLFGFLLPVRLALPGIGLFLLLALLLSGHASALFELAQAGPVMLLCAGIAGTFIYLREIRQRQLRPLRRTDNLTTAATQEHLEDDLAKEIQRSEREGSELSVIALALDREHTERLDARDLDDATIEIGRLLHNNLRLFDSYYLWKTQEFLIVLPHTSSAQAVKIANTIRVRIRRELKIKGESISVSMGVSGLNVGDEPRSLTERAERALEATRHKASNRTHLYRETEPTTEDDVDPVDGSVGDDE